MDELPGKLSSGVGFHRRQSSITLRDSIQDRRSMQNCSISRYSTSHNSARGVILGNQERPQFSRRTFHSGKRNMVGSSFMPFPSYVNPRTTQEKWHIETTKEKDVESSSRQEQINELTSSSRSKDALNLELTRTTTQLQAVPAELGNLESEIHNNITVDASGASGSSSGIARLKPGKKTNRRAENLNRDMFLGSPFQHSVTSNTLQGQSGSAERYGRRNMNCISIPDILSSGSSSLDHASCNRLDVLKRRCPPSESNVSRGQGTTTGCSDVGSSAYQKTTNVPSVSEHPMPQHTLRRTRNHCISRGGAVSVRTRRASNREVRTNLPEQGDDDMVSLHEPLLVPQAIRETPLSSLREVTAGRPSSRNNTAHRRLVHLEDRSTRMSCDFLAGGGYQDLSMNRITDVLLALERFDQDEYLPYEQLVLFETNLFSGGFGAHDQHRDMRLDIDNMSYEELLALEEKMGTVSTALTEEALTKCLKKHIYVPTSSISSIIGCNDDDVKCSICQEEYTAGEEVGKLGCEHAYHVACVHQWLRMKNWCPICKTSATNRHDAVN